MKNFNPKLYEILQGVNKYSSQEEIKQAYKTMAKLHHPDLNPDKEDDNGMMTKLNEAYEILSNSEKRRVYDEQLKTYEERKNRERIKAEKKRRTFGRKNRITSSPIPMVLAGLGILFLGLWINSDIENKN